MFSPTSALVYKPKCGSSLELLSKAGLLGLNVLRCPVGLLGLCGPASWPNNRLGFQSYAGRSGPVGGLFFIFLLYLFLSCFFVYLEFLCEYFCFRYKKLQTFCQCPQFSNLNSLNFELFEISVNHQFVNNLTLKISKGMKEFVCT